MFTWASFDDLLVDILRFAEVARVGNSYH